MLRQIARSSNPYGSGGSLISDLQGSGVVGALLNRQATQRREEATDANFASQFPGIIKSIDAHPNNEHIIRMSRLGTDDTITVSPAFGGFDRHHPAAGGTFE